MKKMHSCSPQKISQLLQTISWTLYAISLALPVIQEQREFTRNFYETSAHLGIFALLFGRLVHISRLANITMVIMFAFQKNVIMIILLGVNSFVLASTVMDGFTTGHLSNYGSIEHYYPAVGFYVWFICILLNFIGLIIPYLVSSVEKEKAR